jgi:FtsH-binding integral membrane protein
MGRSTHERASLIEREEQVDEQLTPGTETPSELPAPPEVPAAPAVVAEAADKAETTKPAPEEKKARTGGKWTLTLGALVILGGLIYLLYELGWFTGKKDVSHWWGFLILIPAVLSFVIAWWMSVKKAKKFGWGVLRWVVIGLAFIALALVFAFKANLNEVWPVLVIIVGVGVALSWKG